MRNIILPGFLLFFFDNIFSQDFYISVNNDTIRGTVLNYKEWVKNPSSVIFSTYPDNKQIELTPFNCKRFTTHSEVYISYHGTRLKNSENTSDINSQFNSLPVKDSIHVFLRELYNFEDYTVYKLFDNVRTNLYLGKKGSISELEYYEYVDDSKKIVRYNNYKEHLVENLKEKNIDRLWEKTSRLRYN